MKARCREDKQKLAKTLIKGVMMSLKSHKDDTPTFVLKKHLKGVKGRTVTGFYDEERDLISLAVFCDIIPTIIHEEIHYLYKNWTETQVTSAERVVRHYITMEEIVKILKLFVKRL